ncbi:LytTr DNA-binding domain-containing protein [[Clostridium] polysaccharolyticum]|uniref:LytTr DNA-binding domain-containing protein n=2 Tax=[Clostridium] polysaccharolyticum TaxID=29364 RepID=A0A1I0CRU9_9FIRM|nr:LytTr DNA-binding domain-containing protein [[Clostridium] polysaccharolyticum]
MSQGKLILTVIIYLAAYAIDPVLLTSSFNFFLRPRSKSKQCCVRICFWGTYIIILVKQFIFYFVNFYVGLVFVLICFVWLSSIISILYSDSFVRKMSIIMTYYVLSFIVEGIFSIVFVSIILSNVKKKEDEAIKRAELSESKLEFLNYSREKFEEIKTIRHDMKKHYNTLLELSRRKEYNMEITFFCFLQKPVNAEEFKQVFQKIMLQMNGLRVTRMNRLVSLNSKFSVKERDIFCVEKVSETKNIRVTTSRSTYTFRGTIKEVQKILGNSFIRISRNALINVHYIFQMQNGVVELSNDKIFPIAPSKEKEIKMFYSQIIS